MVAQGFDKLGYDSIHMDDCVSAGSVPLRPSSTRSPRVHFASQWEQKVPPRDPATGQLRGDPIRFPSGMKVRSMRDDTESRANLVGVT